MHAVEKVDREVFALSPMTLGPEVTQCPLGNHPGCWLASKAVQGNNNEAWFLRGY